MNPESEDKIIVFEGFEDAMFSEFNFDLLKEPLFEDSDPNFERLVGIGFDEPQTINSTTVEKNSTMKTANSTPIFNFSEA